MKYLFFSLFISLNLSAGEVKDFSLPKYKDDKTFKLSEHLGKKTIVLNFWATWCTSCIQELPELHALKAKYPSALFIGINSGEKKKLIKKFLKRHKFDFEHLVDPKMKVADLYGITAIPVTIVIDKNKKIVFNGARPPKNL
ncbi:MAG: hypothetical protein CME70_16955 [Halobacteriovorax sp.]|nr:hypothetical protein [Halobacteriovorax sp.]|tara:strand:+ start:137869 stop:138291 length:423 start_codon:yes stop_codon:yes gene_type:complete